MLSYRSLKESRPFSLVLYLLIVFFLSWPFQIAYVILGDNPTSSMLLSSISMVMVTVGTFICGRWVFRDGFKNMGWNWGKPQHYLWVFALGLLIFAIPVLIENLFGLHTMPLGLAIGPILGGFLFKLSLTIIPGFGEEFGWRAYLLPRLTERYGHRKSLLLHAFIWWAWHLPAIIGIGLQAGDHNTQVWVSVLFTILITLIPSMMNAILFAYVWLASGSLVVVSIYHALFDEIRDTLEQFIGFGPLVSVWEMVVTTVFGAILLWKGNWGSLFARMKQPK